MTNNKASTEIPVTMKPFVQQTFNYFSSKKGKDRFLKEYKLEVESKEDRIRERKVAKARKDTYKKAQLLGINLTNKGHDEFAEEYQQAPADTTTLDLPDSTTRPVLPMKKSFMLNKNKKKFTIFILLPP